MSLGRRRFIAAIAGGLVLAAPLAARAQPAGKVPRIGYLAPVFPCSGPVPSLAAFRRGLRELGYVEGRTITIECRTAEGKPDRLAQLAVDLVQLRVEIIVAAGGEPVARAARQATSTVPIVMTNGGDPVRSGLVASLAPPAAHATALPPPPPPFPLPHR